MKHIYEGKTKTVFELEDGNFLLQFKDDVTGQDGKFDPGANEVGLSIEGMGKKIEEAGILTHFISADLDKASMKVRPATAFGHGIEVICRFKAVGSFMRRYGQYAKDGQALDAFVEVTLKDDAREDPPITKDALDMLGILSAAEYEELKALTQKISGIVKAELAKKGADLYDIKLEFGRVGGKVALIDEISGGNMRVYKDGAIVDPMDLPGVLFG